MPSVVTSGTRSGVSVFSGSALRVSYRRSPQRSEGGFPATARRKYTEHRLQNKHKSAEEHRPSANKETKKLNTKPLSRKAKGFSFVRDTGIEPVTSSVSGKRATAAPIALTKRMFCCEVRTGFEPAYTALQAAA